MVPQRSIEIKELGCPRCRKPFQASEHQAFVPRAGGEGLLCRKCMDIVQKVNELERKLLREAFSLEKEDEKLAAQIDAILAKEDGGTTADNEHLVLSLAGKMIKDESRLKRIMGLIGKLQKKKEKKGILE